MFLNRFSRKNGASPSLLTLGIEVETCSNETLIRLFKEYGCGNI